jgi:DNA-binding SARP family transcriptional activator
LSEGLDFRILGPLEVSDGERMLRLGGAKQRGVLAILLLHAGEVVSVDRLIDELWADDPRRTRRPRCTSTSRGCAGSSSRTA